MKKSLFFFAFLLSLILCNAQNDRVSIPGGTGGITTTTSGFGVGVGDDFTDPEAELHILGEQDQSTALRIDVREKQTIQGGIPVSFKPDFMIQGVSEPFGIQSDAEFTVDFQGRLQLGGYKNTRNEQLVVNNEMALYKAGGHKMRFDFTNNEPRVFWRSSPGRNFKFVNQNTSAIALQLGENGDVGVGTDDFTTAHVFHVRGGALSDRNVVQPTAQWDTTDDYLGMFFETNPQIRWDSESTAYFEFKAEDTGEIPLTLSSSGKVGINTNNFLNSDHSLYIAGSSVAEEMFVKLSGDWGDFVFEKEYDLMPLDQLEDYLEENKHLPDFPSAAEVEKDGLALGETERLLTIKVEELTLYILELKKEIDTLREEIKD
jgi:hypothetical protein